MDLSTTYLGLSLKNPVIVASCGLTKTVEQIKECEQAGAGAVVMKSLLEEQIRESEAEMEKAISSHPEVMDYLRADIDMRYGAEKYTDIIASAKREVSIPVIASVNCYTAEWWTTYAKQIEEAGADALELNVYVMPVDSAKTAAEIERVYLDILKEVKAQVKIPVALKLSPYFTSFGNVARTLESYGADGLVLFNRFVQPDIEISTLSTTIKPSFNDPVGFGRALRWIGLLSGTLDLDIAASGGIRDEKAGIKMLLAGASVIQMASVLYSEGVGHIQKILAGLEQWMEDKHFSSIADFRGRLNQVHNPQDAAYIRAQYIKAIGIE
ncbi:dihydroorotate dehydrogenase-like protein [candidate division KSB3 bacterium]|uniref:Dihydroorotate dehydrogenase-like protein n=1 Tax=candidate division KSB3 bacterium TaxID=2044937 RepID=A0A9D5JXR8_9BACT|nr:dihydroorotate dehydrogenase-like protein [candidate division KSB3 bacterium]MBD3326118.1 dihydroorotate dehydrogenase-like protein [candidate division KSB3 bacterium]